MDNPGSESSSLDTAQAADAFSSLFSGESNEESGTTAVTETPEEAAERLLAEDANQSNADDGKQDPDAKEAPDSTVEIEVDGKPVKLTKAELAEHYKNGLRQQDYTRKTMETAEARKTADAETQRTRAERDNYAQKLNNFAISSESILAEQAQVLTEELLRSDPVEYMAQERTFRQRQAELTKAHQELARINGEKQQEQAEAQANYAREQFEKLTEALPEWKDQAKATAESAKIKDYLLTQGWEMKDINALSDHRHVLAARKAMQFDALMARAKETAGKVQKAPPKVERPGNGVAPTDGRTKAMKTLDSSGGSLNAAAGVFAQFL